MEFVIEYHPIAAQNRHAGDSLDDWRVGRLLRPYRPTASTAEPYKAMYIRAPRWLAIFSSLATFFLPAAAADVLRSTSLNACQENSGFTASLFDVTYNPKTKRVLIKMIATSSIEGKVAFDIAIIAYGLTITEMTLDPCSPDFDLRGMCPMRAGKMDWPMDFGLTGDSVSQIPGIAYTFPDLDAVVRVYVRRTDGPQTGVRVACVEANISNGKTGMLDGYPQSSWRGTLC